MDNTDYKVSVIINSLNGEKYLNNSISSVLKQTYANFEIIFWDNCSIDNSYLLIKKFKDNRLKYFFSKTLDSLPTARNKALSKASSNLIAILDVDDEWSKYKLERQVNIFKKNPGVKLVYTNCYLLNNESLLFKKKIRFKKILPSGLINKSILENYKIAHSTIMFQFNKNENLKVYNEKYNIINDFVLCEKISRKQKIIAIQEPLTTILIHKNSQNSINKKKEVLELEIFYNYLLKSQIKNKNLIYLFDKINYLKIVRNLEYHNKLNYFKKIYSLKSNSYKIKAFLSIIFPNIIINFLKKL